MRHCRLMVGTEFFDREHEMAETTDSMAEPTDSSTSDGTHDEATLHVQAVAGEPGLDFSSRRQVQP